MSLLVKMTLSAALVLSIGVPFGAFAAGEKTKGRYKTALGVNVFLFFGTMIAAAASCFQEMHLQQRKQQQLLLTVQPEWAICQRLLQPVFPV